MEEPRAAASLEVDAQLVSDISALVDADERGMVLNLVTDLHPADMANLIEHLSLERAHLLFSWLDTERASEVLAEMDSAFRAALLEDVHADRIAEIVDEMETDDAVDVLAELPEEVVEQVITGLEDEEDVRELMAYGEDTAGGIMGTELVALRSDTTVAEATEDVRRNAETVEHVFAVYVVDREGRLQGIVTLQRLLLAPADARMGEIMETDFHAVTPEVDQEEVASIMERYDLISMPVVDEQGCLVGRITIDDIVDVIREESEEDMLLMSGISAGDEEARDSVFEISRGRLPWLLLGMGGAFLSGSVITGFQDGLQKAVVLAVFIPIVTAMGGNAAVQSGAIAVQGLISGTMWASELYKRMGKELLVAFANGLVLSLLLSGAVLLVATVFPGVLPLRNWTDAAHLALTVGLAMFTVIVVATANGAMIPFILHRLGADPASAMGPFVTTLNDIIGLSVYFLIARIIYL